MIEVVSALIVREGRLLLTQRPAGKDFPFHWESPGGKVMSGEFEIGALDRELQEELGVQIRRELVPTVPVFRQELRLTRTARVLPDQLAEPVQVLEIQQAFYEVPWAAVMGTPVPAEGQGLGWFGPDEIERLGAVSDALAPGNAQAFRRISALVRLSGRPDRTKVAPAFRTVGGGIGLRESVAVPQRSDPSEHTCRTPTASGSATLDALGCAACAELRQSRCPNCNFPECGHGGHTVRAYRSSESCPCCGKGAR